jgi:16S rRNA (guanine966-N2)-methyltransferase
LRVVGGSLRGRALAAPKTDAIRPTSDRVREAIFNIVVHAHPEALRATRVLDLFAGTGALGIEALSRAAAHCLFVEESAEGRALLRTNIEALGLQGRTRIFRRDATRLGEAGNMAPFDFVLADPPYGRGLAEKAISSALEGGWLAPGALIMVEEAAATPFSPPPGIALIDTRAYGETVIALCRAA